MKRASASARMNQLYYNNHGNDQLQANSSWYGCRLRPSRYSMARVRLERDRRPRSIMHRRLLATSIRFAMHTRMPPRVGSAPCMARILARLHRMNMKWNWTNYVFHTKKRQIFEDKVSMLLRFTYTPSIKAVDSVQRFSIILPFQVDFPKYCEFPSRNKALKITCNRQSITISPAGAHTVTCNEIKIPYNNATLPTCYPQSPPYTVPRQLNYFSPRSPWSMFQNLKRIV
jgi:hypothetical protein